MAAESVAISVDRRLVSAASRQSPESAPFRAPWLASTQDVWLVRPQCQTDADAPAKTSGTLHIDCRRKVLGGSWSAKHAQSILLISSDAGRNHDKGHTYDLSPALQHHASGKRKTHGLSAAFLKKGADSTQMRNPSCTGQVIE